MINVFGGYKEFNLYLENLKSKRIIGYLFYGRIRRGGCGEMGLCFYWFLG